MNDRGSDNLDLLTLKRRLIGSRHLGAAKFSWSSNRVFRESKFRGHFRRRRCPSYKILHAGPQLHRDFEGKFSRDSRVGKDDDFDFNSVQFRFNIFKFPVFNFQNSDFLSLFSTMLICYSYAVINSTLQKGATEKQKSA